MEPILELNEIQKAYTRSGSQLVVLDKITLTLQPGEFVAVQGPSGSGKSTMLLTAGGLLHPDSGTVKVSGQDLYAMAPESRARYRASNIGFVFQQFHLVPYLTVLENVMVPSLAGPVDNAEKRAAELVSQFGLESRAKHLATELSTGEKQRTALARSLLLGPRLLLADEPTGNLDPDNTEVVLSALANFAEQGGAVLWVTHDGNISPRAHRYVRLDAQVLAEA